MLCIGCESGLLRNGSKLLRSGSGLVRRIVNRWYSAVLCGFVLMVGAAWRQVTPKWSEVTPKRPRIMVLAAQWYCDEALAEIAYIALLREKRLAPTGRDINGKGRS